MECLKPITLYTKFRKLPEGAEKWTKEFRKRWFEHQGSRKVTVPCGKCAFCLTNKRSSWMFRILQEMRHQQHRGYFLTLTYNEKFVARVGPEGQLSLRFRDVQLYLKRIRKAKYYAKYICVGEYGAETQRPHYHMLLWTDAPVEFLEENWKDARSGERLGHIMFGKLEVGSAMYTLKYIIQPKVRQGEDELREKTRAQFSKGLGLAYLDHSVYEHHTFAYDDPQLFVVVDGRKVALPRYYKNKIYTKHQLREVAWRHSLKRHKEKRKEIRAIRDRGINAAHKYLFGLRLDQHLAILKTTKYNLTL